ncbi:MAG: 50S ribosomal protein L24 [Spirochaetaceae bacterium]|jgi:large subunit ribosomal protein L24|nr:50S ribosomal protein L24 [Spirochaetaceae bacterium]
MALVAKQHKIKLKKEDSVEVIAGKDNGKRGKIIKILRDKDRVLIEGVNMVKKAQKRKNAQDRGGIIEIEAPLHISNVMILCKKCGPTRIGYEINGKEKKRICRKCKEAL